MIRACGTFNIRLQLLVGGGVGVGERTEGWWWLWLVEDGGGGEELRGGGDGGWGGGGERGVVGSGRVAEGRN